MDINEAKNKLKETKEEEKALYDYQGMIHANINVLLNWNLNMGKNQVAPVDLELLKSKENIKYYIDVAKKIYSAMYKNYLIEGGLGANLYRGVPESDVFALKNRIEQFLSTTSSKEIAKTFSRGDRPCCIICLCTKWRKNPMDKDST